MATNTLDRDIYDRINSFLTELSGLVRKAALEAVHEALGEGAAPRRRGRPPGAARRGPGRPRKAGRRGRPRGRARAGKRVRRSAADLEAIAARVLAHVKANAGHRLEEIGRALKTDTAILKRPIVILLAAKKLRTEGQKRGTKYFAGGGRGGASKARRKAKPQRRRKSRSNRKANVTRSRRRKKAARRAAPRTIRRTQSRRAKIQRKPARATRPSKARAMADALALQSAMPTAPL